MGVAPCSASPFFVMRATLSADTIVRICRKRMASIRGSHLDKSPWYPRHYIYWHQLIRVTVGIRLQAAGRLQSAA
jgi:hypothetical protein